jgi:hypothetical protein
VMNSGEYGFNARKEIREPRKCVRVKKLDCFGST